MNPDNISVIIAFGTAAMVFIALAVVTFVIMYQRKMFTKQNQLAQLETENQKVLVNAVLTAKEMEQKRIAQELHDEIGSSVNAVRMSLIGMTIDDETKKKLNTELTDISKNVRRISNELMPSVLDELGFHQALVHLVKKYQESSQIEFEILTNLEDPYPLDKKVELSLYRILQELMNNIVKYSKATNVILTIHHNSKEIEINLVDNGDGFIPDENNLTKGDSLGLKNIKSRLQQINGEENYSLNTPKGTKVTIHLKKP